MTCRLIKVNHTKCRVALAHKTSAPIVPSLAHNCYIMVERLTHKYGIRRNTSGNGMSGNTYYSTPLITGYTKHLPYETNFRECMTTVPVTKRHLEISIYTWS